MTHSVYKYALHATDDQWVLMPKGAVLLHVAEQGGGQLYVWAHVDPAAPLVPRRIITIDTGHPAPDIGQFDHVGTVLLHGGRIVLHVFDGEE